MLKKTIKIIAPARLHFGFLELKNNQNNSFGGIGLTIDKFYTKIILKNNNKLQFKGFFLDKASYFIKNFCNKKKIKPNFFLNIEKYSPQHIGLGSGTQLALSIGNAISILKDINLNVEQIAKIQNRGLRSKVGLKNFDHGGFLIDLKIKKKLFNNIEKVCFPEDWKIILIKDSMQGLHGGNELTAFKKINEFKNKNNINLYNLTLMKLYPSLIENNFKEFSKAIYNIQNVMGKYFNIYQGGQFSSPKVSMVLNYLKKQKILGYGQTSWGPTGFIFFPNLKKANEMKRKLKTRFSSCKNLEFIICSGKNSGANIQF